MQGRRWYMRVGHRELIKMCSAWSLDCFRKRQVTAWQPLAVQKSYLRHPWVQHRAGGGAAWVRCRGRRADNHPAPTGVHR